MSAAADSRTRGFTLIEMMVVVMLTAIVLVVAVDFFIQLGTATSAATGKTREGRRAAGILDRVARDLQSTVLVAKPEETDPLEHPWVFLAKAGTGSIGAESLLFVNRGRIARASAIHESDLERVAYFLAEDEDGTTSLMRWASPRLPDALERELPRASDAGVLVLAHEVAAFGVRLLDEEGQWVDEWDSSTLVRSSQLPLAAEISVAVYSEQAVEGDDIEVSEPTLWSRRVELPVRPLDLVAALDPEGSGGAGEDGDEEDDEDENAEDGGGGEDEESCVTVAQCLTRTGYTLPPELQGTVSTSDCVRDYAFQLSQYGVSLEACQ